MTDIDGLLRDAQEPSADELTDEDRAAIAAALETGKWNHPFLCADVELVYRAGLAAGRARAIEEAAKVAAPYGKRPCDCERCDCGNIGDAQNVAAWDAEASCTAAIRALLQTGSKT